LHPALDPRIRLPGQGRQPRRRLIFVDLATSLWLFLTFGDARQLRQTLRQRENASDLKTHYCSDT
jgi:hypothetical protein